MRMNKSHGRSPQYPRTAFGAADNQLVSFAVVRSSGEASKSLGVNVLVFSAIGRLPWRKRVTPSRRRCPDRR